MAARPSWDGFLKFNLLSVPVKAYSANVSGGGRIGFHLIHKGCNSRIRYKKACPIHGEISNDEIVTAYEQADGQYVIVEADERKNLRAVNDKAMAIDTFVAPEAVDPIYFTDRTYYLVPDGQVAQKPYAVLREAMAKEKRYAIAQLVFSGQGRVAVVHATESVLAMTLLNYEEQIKKPTAFAGEVTGDASPEELKLAETLIEAATARDFDLGRYHDEYTASLLKLIQARGKVQNVVTEPGREEEEPAVINLVDALRRSLAQARQGAGRKKGGRQRQTRKGPAANAARRKTG